LNVVACKELQQIAINNNLNRPKLNPKPTQPRSFINFSDSNVGFRCSNGFGFIPYHLGSRIYKWVPWKNQKLSNFEMRIMRSWALVDACNSSLLDVSKGPPTIVSFSVFIIFELITFENSKLFFSSLFKEWKFNLAWNYKKWGHPLGCGSSHLCLYSCWNILYQIGDLLELWSMVQKIPKCWWVLKIQCTKNTELAIYALDQVHCWDAYFRLQIGHYENFTPLNFQPLLFSKQW
jgi:hypothetical protein